MATYFDDSSDRAMNKAIDNALLYGDTSRPLFYDHVLARLRRCMNESLLGAEWQRANFCGAALTASTLAARIDDMEARHACGEDVADHVKLMIAHVNQEFKYITKCAGSVPHRLANLVQPRPVCAPTSPPCLPVALWRYVLSFIGIEHRELPRVLGALAEVSMKMRQLVQSGDLLAHRLVETSSFFSHHSELRLMNPSMLLFDGGHIMTYQAECLRSCSRMHRLRVLIVTHRVYDTGCPTDYDYEECNSHWWISTLANLEHLHALLETSLCVADLPRLKTLVCDAYCVSLHARDSDDDDEPPTKPMNELVSLKLFRSCYNGWARSRTRLDVNAPKLQELVMNGPIEAKTLACALTSLKFLTRLVATIDLFPLEGEEVLSPNKQDMGIRLWSHDHHAGGHLHSLDLSVFHEALKPDARLGPVPAWHWTSFAPAHLTALRQLTLRHFDMLPNELSGGMLQVHCSLEALCLQNFESQLNPFSESVLMPLRNLTSLSLMSHAMYRLSWSAPALGFACRLRHLRLSTHEPRPLVNMVAGQLLELDLSWCSGLDDETFLGLTQLTKLALRHCEVEDDRRQLSKTALVNLTQLRMLDAFNCSLAVLSPENLAAIGGSLQELNAVQCWPWDSYTRRRRPLTELTKLRRLQTNEWSWIHSTAATKVWQRGATSDAASHIPIITERNNLEFRHDRELAPWNQQYR